MSLAPINRQVVLDSRPTGMVDLKNFSMRETPVSFPGEGQVLVRTLYLTVDPYMRGRMNDVPSYIEPFVLHHPLTGGVVGRVEKSKSAEFTAREYVYGLLDWADYSLVDAKTLQKLVPQQKPITTALGVLGMPGMTAYFGLLDIGKPKKGETVLVSGAAGAVGSLVGQIAKIKGCHVVGIAGSDRKVKYLIDELGFDAALNYKNADFAEKLKQACPRGVDVYFDNVGGDITDQALKLINMHARISICGQISMYNLDKPDIGPRNWWLLLTKRALVKGFINSDYAEHFPEALNQMSQWIASGQLKYKETMTNGLENAPKAFLGLFKGENTGKQLVEVAKD